MTGKLTEELLGELLSTKNINKYLGNDDIKDSVNLCDFLNGILEQKNLKKSDVIKEAKLNSTFAYQIFNGERNPGRNKILQLTLGMKLSLKETQRALKYGSTNELYPKNKRDAIIIYCINGGKSIEEVDDTLYSFGESTIYGE